MAAKGTAEYTKRGENFSKELDFVFANVIMALIADFCLVWLPSPTISFKYAANTLNDLLSLCAPTKLSCKQCTIRHLLLFKSSAKRHNGQGGTIKRQR